MKYLLDTSAWLRGLLDPASIPANVRRMIGGPKVQLALSVISVWEAAKKNQIGKFPLQQDLASWLKDALPNNIIVLPLSVEIIADAMRLPAFPNRDPTDELIVATARVHRLTLVTSDNRLKHYPPPTRSMCGTGSWFLTSMIAWASINAPPTTPWRKTGRACAACP